MGRAIVADENIQSIIKYLTSLPDCSVGLVIGQTTQQKDFVCHLANTPKDDVEHDAQDKSSESKGKNKEKNKTASSLEDIDESLVIHHARQVSRMLPGGIDILGVFVTYHSESLPQNVLSKLKQILIGIFKMLEKQIRLSNSNETAEKVILHVQPQRVMAKVFDLSNIHMSAKPAEFRFQSSGLSWHRLECRLALDLTIPIGIEDSKSSLIKQIHIGLSPFHSAVNSAVVLIDGQLKLPKELLDFNKEIRRGKQKDKAATNFNHIAEVFIESDSFNKEDENVLCKCGAKMLLRGTLQSRAFVHNKASFQEAVQAIKQDILRSLYARFEIHCEDGLIIDEEQQDPCVVHEPPRRVFAPFSSSGLTVSDYLFPGEKADDSLEAFKELLSLSLTENDIEINCERLADSTDLASNASETKTNIATSYELLNSSSTSSMCNPLVIALSIAVSVLAFSVSFMLLRETQ